MPSLCIAGHRFYDTTIGGVELQTKYIGDILSDAGWNVTYLAPSPEGRTGADTVDGRRLWWFPSFDFAFQAPLRLVRRALKEIQPDAIYQRGRGSLTGRPVVLRAAREQHTPYIYALSSDAELQPWFESRQNIADTRPWIKRILLVPYYAFVDRSLQVILRRCDYLVAQHADQVARLQARLGRTASILPSLHPRVSGALEKPADKTVLWVANYRPLKQGRLFVDLARRCTDLPCRFIMVYGRTKPHYIEPVLAEAKDLGNFSAQGLLSPGEVESLMANACLFVNTSIYEGFPNTFVQCWLRETPTITLQADPGGVIAAQQLGHVSGTFEQLVDDVRSLLTDDRQRLDLGRRARTYAEKAHSLEANRAKIVSFFSGCLPRRSAP